MARNVADSADHLGTAVICIPVPYRFHWFHRARHRFARSAATFDLLVPIHCTDVIEVLKVSRGEPEPMNQEHEREGVALLAAIPQDEILMKRSEMSLELGIMRHRRPRLRQRPDKLAVVDTRVSVRHPQGACSSRPTIGSFRAALGRPAWDPFLGIPH
jgi:hypothetical protein